MKRRQIDLSYDLEKRLEQAAERIRQAITKPAEIKNMISQISTGRRIIKPVPDDVRKWFEENEGLEDD